MPETPLIVRGGLPVSPREVEQVLLGHPAVAAAVVVGVPCRRSHEVIVAAAVQVTGPLPSTATDLTAYCRARLAGYKVPARWLFAGSLPRTAAGEPRRAAIAALLAAAPGSSGRSAAWSRTGLRGTATARLAAVRPVDLFRPRAAIEDLRVPPQLRRSWAPDDLA
jgi:acyl-CoA synthetase (AMP-forming)/AMP-acid ligase II